MDSKFIQIELLKADVRTALANKKNSHTDQWDANKANHEEAACQLLRIRDVSKLTTLSKSCIYLWVAQGRFPVTCLLHSCQNSVCINCLVFQFKLFFDFSTQRDQVIAAFGLNAVTSKIE